MTLIRGLGRTVHAHPMVLETAQGMAREIFSEAMRRDNQLFRAIKVKHPEKSTVDLEKVFVRRMTPRLLREARATLARLIAVTPQKDLQERISEALLLDNTLRRGRVRL